MFNSNILDTKRDSDFNFGSLTIMGTSPFYKEKHFCDILGSGVGATL